MTYEKRLQSKTGKEVKMKKLSFFTVAILVFAAVVAIVFIPLHGNGDPGSQLIADPTSLDFGEVEVGQTNIQTVTLAVSNGVPVFVNGLDLQSGSSSDFQVILPPLPFSVDPGYSIQVMVAFSPSSEGEAADILEIHSNADNQLITVNLSGVGTASAPQPITIEDILQFFDAGVEAETIAGTGRADAAKTNHLKVFKFKLLMVAFFLEQGLDPEACTLLWHAYERCDGQHPLKDFIEGQDVPELNAMTLELIDDLGCE
jgi:hypothetical protein